MRDFRMKDAMMAGVMVLLLAGVTRAEVAGISVSGQGTAKARSTEVEIYCTISGEAELAADATVKFRDARKRALAAIAALKNSDVTVTSEGVSVNNAVDENAVMMRQRGMPVTSKPRVEIMEKDKIILAHADKMEPEALLDAVLKIVDVAKDAGFQIAGMASSPQNYYNGYSVQPQAVVWFKLSDTKALREQAYKAAMEDARAKAQALADLSGTKLGKVVSITESDGPKVRTNDAGTVMTTGEDKSVVGSTSGELSTSVNLTVVFEIAK